MRWFCFGLRAALTPAPKQRASSSHDSCNCMQRLERLSDIALQESITFVFGLGGCRPGRPIALAATKALTSAIESAGCARDNEKVFGVTIEDCMHQTWISISSLRRTLCFTTLPTGNRVLVVQCDCRFAENFHHIGMGEMDC